MPAEAIAADLLGLRVGETDLPVSGLLLPAERRIWLNAAEARASPERRRFTLAHEIGHWVCQCLGRAGAAAPILCRDAEVRAGGAAALRPLEREANVFAAEMLMPEPAVRAARREGAPAGALARLFGVSGPAMAWRLYDLGLADHPPPGPAGPPA